MRISLAQAKQLGIKIPGDKAKRQRPADGMNGTESKFANQCLAWGVDCEFESVKFRIADRTWFTPDFRVSLDSAIGNDVHLIQQVFVEVKARTKNGKVLYRDDAIVKLKACAEVHPWPFFLASLGPSGWEVKLIQSRRWGHLFRRIMTPW